jgi:hypothetical protein
MSLSRSGETGPGRVSETGLTRLHVLITAETTADPSGTPGETGSAVGISTDPGRPGWIRLHPLAPDDRFRPYDIITVDARRPTPEQGADSWQPAPRTVQVNHHLKQWRLRQRWLDRHVEESMCRLDEESGLRSDARSLALVRPREVDAVEIEPHPGWTADEWRRVDRWLRVPALAKERPGVAPQPPRFRGAYRYRCHQPGCAGHRQRILDREFLALQHRLAGLSDARLRQALTNTFLTRMCGPDRDTAFYVGAQTFRDGGFRVLGTYWPPRS